jgi:hypothetical protein
MQTTPIVLRGDLQEVQDLKNILNSFANATGLQISFHKSTAVPSNMPDDLIQHCTSVLGCRQEVFPQNYLGLPLSSSKLPVSVFNTYIDKTDRFLSTWQASLLNTMGRVVLIKSVLDSQLVYIISAMQVPPTVVIKLISVDDPFFAMGTYNFLRKVSCGLEPWTKVCTPRD